MAYESAGAKHAAWREQLNLATRGAHSGTNTVQLFQKLLEPRHTGSENMATFLPTHLLPACLSCACTLCAHFLSHLTILHHLAQTHVPLRSVQLRL